MVFAEPCPAPKRPHIATTPEHGLVDPQQLIEYLFGIRRRSVLKAPAHGDRVVEDERCQARPSLMRSLMVTPAGSRFPWRSSRICATASAGVLRLTSRDNGFPSRLAWTPSTIISS